MNPSWLWLLVLSCSICVAAEAYSGGDGTNASPYVLAARQDILDLASDPANFGKSFILAADIDMEGETFEHSLIVADSYARGDAAGAHSLGGLIGENTAFVSRCYSTGLLAGVDEVGGLVGREDAKADTLYCLWDVDSSGIQTSSGGAGISRKRMEEIGTFLERGWDFVGETANGNQDLWTMADDGYPALTMSQTYTRISRR
jgi:hypothetical protein